MSGSCDSVATRRFLLLLLGLFAVATLVMAAIGLVRRTSQAVAGRRREFGIRVALGASRLGYLRRWCSVADSSSSPSASSVGLAAVAALGGLLGSQLYETAPTDPVTLALAAAMLARSPRSPRTSCRCGAPPGSSRT